MKTAEEILANILKCKVSDIYSHGWIHSALRAMEEYRSQPDPNPYKIDEERLSNFYLGRTFKEAIEEYNSTLPEPLRPLPSSSILSDEIYDLEWHTLTPQDCEKLADYLISKYGTPKREKLSVKEEVIKRLCAVSVNLDILDVMEINSIMNLLEVQPREWWMDLKDGDKFMVKIKGKYEIYTFKKLEAILVYDLINDSGFFSQACTPYIEPVMTADDVIKAHNLSEAEVKAIREGKCWNIFRVEMARTKSAFFSR